MNQKKLVFLFSALAFAVLCATAGSHTCVAAKTSALHVKGTKIVNEAGKTVVLKGVSTHGIAWYPAYVNKQCFRSFQKMGANTVRLAFYSDDSAGYNKSLYAKVDEGVKAATELGMYVILDWHILSDGNPKTNEGKAKEFFTYFAKKYAGQPNVLYEICNEPNGDVTWKRDIKPYAERMIRLIRKYDKKAVIIVGTPTWSQDVDVAADDPIRNQSNIAYALHFYAATHKEWIRDKLKAANKKGFPVIVTEYSICDASGNGAIDTKEAKAWMKLLKQYKVGRIAWNISNKNETSALIQSSCNKTGQITKRNLSKSGKWIVKNW